jgi:hypothetical protein
VGEAEEGSAAEAEESGGEEEAETVAFVEAVCLGKFMEWGICREQVSVVWL